MPTLTFGASTWTQDKGVVFGLVPQAVQFNHPLGETEGTAVYVYDKGIDDLFVAKWERLPTVNKNDLITFLRTTVNGLVNAFTYTDPFGSSHTVRLFQTRLDPVYVSFGFWNMELLLRKERT